MKSTHPATFSLLAAVIANLACSVFVGGPELPDAQPTQSAESLQALESQLQDAIAEGVNTGVLKVQLSQEQLTAYVSSRLATVEPPLLSNPQIVLGDQQLILYGRASSGMVEANVAVTTEFSVDGSGQPDIRITDAQLGPLPMPQALQDAIATAMNEALAGSIGPAALGFRLESIDISGGVMTLTGRLH
jgi:hypothetical protein